MDGLFSIPGCTGLIFVFIASTIAFNAAASTWRTGSEGKLTLVVYINKPLSCVLLILPKKYKISL